MYSIGQRLRDERVRQGLKLSDVSEKTRIRTVFLEAIEADQFDALPGRFYARSFVRQYARLLGIHDPELEAEIARELGEPGPVVTAEQVLASLGANVPERAPIVWRARLDPRWLAYATVGLLAVAGVLGAYLGWQRIRARAEARQAAAAIELQASPPQQTESVPASRPEPAPTAPPLVVEVAARTSAWTQVVTDGTVAFVGTLQAGQQRTFRASDKVRILTGNAGALDIRRNGTPLGPLGPEGQVRTIELTREGHTVSAPKPKASEEKPAPAEPSAPGEAPAPLPLNPQ